MVEDESGNVVEVVSEGSSGRVEGVDGVGVMDVTSVDSGPIFDSCAIGLVVIGANIFEEMVEMGMEEKCWMLHLSMVQYLFWSHAQYESLYYDWKERYW